MKTYIVPVTTIQGVENSSALCLVSNNAGGGMFGGGGGKGTGL